MFRHNENYGNRDTVELVKRRYRDLEELKPGHDLLSLAEISDNELRLGNKIRGGERYNFKLVNYVRLLGRSIREELEKRLEEEGLLKMVKFYF